MARRKKKRDGPELWTFAVGDKGRGRVVVEELTPGGIIRGRVWDAVRGNYRKQSLGHRDQERAQQWALEQHQQLKRVIEGHPLARRDEAEPNANVGQVLNEYARLKTPTKSKAEQKADERRTALFRATLGTTTDVRALDPSKPQGQRLWEDGYLRPRVSGQINARGERKKPAGTMRSFVSVEAELKWIVWVMQWAMRRGLVPHVATITVKTLRETLVGWPEVHSKPRPMMGEARYLALRAVAPNVRCAVRAKDPTTGRVREVLRASPLMELLDIAADTGHRITAVVSLRASDFIPHYADPETGDHAPFGAVRWRAEHDKMNHAHISYLGEVGYRAVRRLLADRDKLGDAPLFPARDNPMQPITRHVAYKWIRRAEDLAGLEHVEDLAWHGFRVKFGTDHAGVSLVDLAAQGGWISTATLAELYQRPTFERMVDIATKTKRHA